MEMEQTTEPTTMQKTEAEQKLEPTRHISR